MPFVRSLMPYQECTHRLRLPGQVVDFFAMSTDTAKDGYLREVMSMHHSHDSMGKLIPAPGDTFVTSTRKPIMTVIEDTGPGVHDTLVAACDHYLYENELGISPEVAPISSASTCCHSEALVCSGNIDRP